jgi:hypothetical protein
MTGLPGAKVGLAGQDNRDSTGRTGQPGKIS